MSRWVICNKASSAWWLSFNWSSTRVAAPSNQDLQTYPSQLLCLFLLSSFFDQEDSFLWFKRKICPRFLMFYPKLIHCKTLDLFTLSVRVESSATAKNTCIHDEIISISKKISIPDICCKRRREIKNQNFTHFIACLTESFLEFQMTKRRNQKSKHFCGPVGTFC